MHGGGGGVVGSVQTPCQDLWGSKLKIYPFCSSSKTLNIVFSSFVTVF